MRKWDPTREWSNEDAYIIGGGPSLRSFDWGLLRDKRTIGCNSAFCLEDVCEIVIFADEMWWDKIGSHQLPAFSGRVVASGEWLERRADIPDWVWYIPREGRKSGLSSTGLGFNNNTGSLAINLALRLGARRVFLLGFDMKMDGDRANWHDLRCQAPRPRDYPFFLDRMRTVARDVPLMFPGQEVINVSDGSDLLVFPTQGINEHFRGALV